MQHNWSHASFTKHANTSTHTPTRTRTYTNTPIYRSTDTLKRTWILKNSSSCHMVHPPVALWGGKINLVGKVQRRMLRWTLWCDVCTLRRWQMLQPSFAETRSRDATMQDILHPPIPIRRGVNNTSQSTLAARPTSVSCGVLNALSLSSKRFSLGLNRHPVSYKVVNEGAHFFEY